MAESKPVSCHFPAYTSVMDIEEKNQQYLASLLYEAKQGNNEAFGKIYEDFFTPVFRYIFLRTQNKSLAEDLTQNVFIKFHRNLTRYSNQENKLLAYLFTIARNALIDFQRKKQPEFLEAIPDNANILHGKAASPEADTQNNLDNEAILKALEKITSEQAEVIELKFFYGFSNTEIAKIMSKSEVAVRQLQSRGIRELRKHLKY